MDDAKRLELQSMPDDLMKLAKDQFGPHYLQFEIWVGRVIDMAFNVGKASNQDDADRYRFLRSNLESLSGDPFICYWRGAFVQWTGDHADQAVDEAIQRSRVPQAREGS